jgi:hypothetical protein
VSLRWRGREWLTYFDRARRRMARSVGVGFVYVRRRHDIHTKSALAAPFCA